MAPHAGDEVQFMKAGVMEVPDAFVLNKLDLAGAGERSFAQLRAALRLSGRDRENPPRQRAHRRRRPRARPRGITAVPTGGLSAREPAWLERWVAAEHGKAGVARLAQEGGAAAFIARHGGFDAAQLAF